MNLTSAISLEPNITMTAILFLTADPSDESRLRLGQEFREIQEQLERAQLRSQFKLEIRTSVRPSDVSQALLNVNPDIVHFAGHGMSSGELCFENDLGQTHPVKPKAFASLFQQFTGVVRCVVVNACNSKTLSKSISLYIDYAIGMSHEIGDKAAIVFSSGFYQALGAGREIEEAYKLGKVQLRLLGYPENSMPILFKKKSQRYNSEKSKILKAVTPAVVQNTSNNWYFQFTKFLLQFTGINKLISSSLFPFQKFLLITGVGGFVIFVVFLASLELRGLQTLREFSGKVYFTLGLILFYSWLAISWFASSRYLFHQSRRKKINSLKPFVNIAIGMDFLIFPLCCRWTYTEATIRNLYNKDEYQIQARFEATQIAQLALTPTRTVGIGTPTPRPIILKTSQQILSEKLGQTYLVAVFFSFSGVLILGTSVVVVLLVLMPIVYPELPTFDWSKLKFWII